MTALSLETPRSTLALPTPPGPRDWDAYLGRHGRSFWMAARLIPEPHRSQVAGVYAYCRYTDDLVDNAACEAAEVVQMLDRWESLARDAYDGRDTGIELLDVVIATMPQHGVPFEYVEGLIRGMRTDMAGVRFETLDDLRGYCHDVASVVGLWLTELFGTHDRWTLERASQLGVAMQLTNIARDVGEDWDRGRLYLPQSMLDQHGVTADVIGALRRSDSPIPSNYAALLEALMGAAECEYDEAAPGIANLPGFFRPAVAVASRVYCGIHDAIRANGYDSIRRRAVTSDASKAALARAALTGL